MTIPGMLGDHPGDGSRPSMASSCKLELARFLLCLESKTEASVAKAQNYMLFGGHCKYLVDEGNNFGGDTEKA